MNINHQQKAFVDFWDDNAVLFSCPGAGKTECIAEKILAGVKSGKISQERTYVFTFTNAAAAEIMNRIKSKGIWVAYVGTIDAYCLQFVSTAATINSIGEEEVKAMIDQKKKVAGLNKLSSNSILEKMANYRGNDPISNEDVFVRFMLSEVRKCGVWTHDLIKSECIRMHKSGQFDECDAVFFDESQDHSPLDWKFASLVGGPSALRFVVGDDDQTLYEFRGADPMMMSILPYKNMRLDTNYRSGTSIVGLSEKLIVNNSNRVQKQIIPGRKDAGVALIIHGHPRIKSLESVIDSLVEEGKGDAVILARYNKDVELIQESIPNPGRRFTAMTIHASKGLQFERVIVYGPGSDARLDEEARRLFYVAMTRAINELYIVDETLSPLVAELRG